MTPCKRAGCPRTLDASQDERGASYCGASCRVAAHKARRVDARRAFLDDLRDLLALVSEASSEDRPDDVADLLTEAEALVDKARESDLH